MMNEKPKRLFINIDDTVLDYRDVVFGQGYYSVKPKSGAIDYLRTCHFGDIEVYIVLVDYNYETQSKHWWVDTHLGFIPKENIIVTGPYDDVVLVAEKKLGRKITQWDYYESIKNTQSKHWYNNGGAVITHDVNSTCVKGYSTYDNETYKKKFKIN